MTAHKKTEQDVLRTYKKVNPSTYWIENDAEEYKRREDFVKNLFLYRLNFPPKMFKDAKLLEFGSGTGEHSLFYLKWGASCTFVEMNDLACQRARKLFRHFIPGRNRYEIINKSLFDFKRHEQYDIVVSLGVIHHTACKEKAFDIKAQYLKDDGFMILGIGNKSGMFQRNVQRWILNELTNNDEDLIISLANELFPEHLDRAEKFGRRSRKAIIYDTFINAKIDTPSVSEILSWLSKNNLKLYSSWPPVVPAVLGDPADRKPLSCEKIRNILSIPEIVYLTHVDDDINHLLELEKKAALMMHPFQELVDLLNDVTPGTHIDPNQIKRKIGAVKKSIKADLNPYAAYFHMLNKLLEETECILEPMKRRDPATIRKCLKNAQVLFRGTCGLGMSWYIAHKVKAS